MRDAAGDDAQGYYRACAQTPLLTPDQEIQLAQEFEQKERQLWTQVLSFPPAVMPVVEVVRQTEFSELGLPNLYGLRKALKTVGPDPERFRRHVLKAAADLRAADDDRHVIKRSLGTIREAFQHGRKKNLRYLDRVNIAYTEAQQTKDRFVKANLRLVASIARPWTKTGMPLSDIMQEGTFGLMKAVERFDYTRGYRFSTYASWWIKQAISRAIHEKSRVVRVPTHALDMEFRIARAERVLRTQHGTASPEQIARYLQEVSGENSRKISLEKIATYQSMCHAEHCSLDHKLPNDDRTFGELLVHPGTDPDEMMYADQWKKKVLELVDKLPELEAAIVRWRFGIGDDEEHTLQQIGDRYGLSRERIRQLQEQALEKLRADLEGSAFGAGHESTARSRPRITREHWRRAAE